MEMERAVWIFFGMSSWVHFGGTQRAEGVCLKEYPALVDRFFL